MIRLLTMVAALILVVGVACSGDSDDDDNGSDPTATTEAAAEATPTEAEEEAAEPTEEEEADNGGAAGDVEGDAESGEALATSAGCVACHSIDGSAGVGPTWQGLWMHDVTLESGETVTADAEYIRTSILEPNEQIVEGFTPSMPSFDGQLDDQEIADITAYIASLE